MNAQLKTAEHRSVLFALLVVATNWHWERKTTKTVGTHSQGAVPLPPLTSSTTTRIDGGGFWILFSIIALIVLGRRLYKDLRLLLDQSVRVPRQMKVVALWPIVLLLPVFISVFYSTSMPADGGGMVATTSGYGSRESTALFALASLMIIVYQVRSVIKGFVPESKP